MDNIDFDKINYFIENNLIDKACQEYIKLNNSIVNNITISDEEKSVFYASFAYFLFDICEYEQSLNMFIRAQNFGYSKEEIKSFICKTFVEPNLQEFKNMYNKNIEYLIENGYMLKAIDFEHLNFWLIPILEENQFYLYDKKNKLIRGKIFFNNDNVDDIRIVTRDEFSDYLIVADWNINRIQKYVNTVKNKMSYIVIEEYNEFLSVLQGIRLNEKMLLNTMIFDGFDNMKQYFKNNNKYIPRNIIELTSERNVAQKVIDEIHQYRITKEGRKGDNVLLSVCIPTYNRGNRAYANIMHSLLSCYDEEIEFVMSNNGTENETKEYYDKIKKICDSRIKYFEFENNQGFAINLCKVSELASGRFMIFISDEDLLVLENLHIIMNILKNGYYELSVVRTKGDGQGILPLTNLCTNTKEALLKYTLSSNYMSGLILNRNLLSEHKGIEYIRDNLNRNEVCFYYPHMYWDLLLCQYGSIQGVDVVLINEGKADEISVDTEKRESSLGKQINIPMYATLEGRLNQHKGFLEIFYALEFIEDDFELFREMYIKLSKKTIFLVSISIEVFYKNISKNSSQILKITLDTCLEYLEKIYNKKEFRKYNKLYESDIRNIEEYYEFHKNKL
ncbi:glycosyltransferase [Clostridium butyricum]|uniref:glycosyltransferase n=1 Tax=Clostridium butyricum TaxID=1492 RepID=UPI003467A2EC